MAPWLGKRNILGFEFPGWAKGVIVPTSIKPKPKAPKQSIKSPFLSSPAAMPSLFLKVSPLKFNDVPESWYEKRRVSWRL